MAVTEAQVNQARLDFVGRRASFRQTLGQLVLDANAYSTQVQGRPLPPPNGLGQLPASGVQITERTGGSETDEQRVTLVTVDQVVWQNLANYLESCRLRGEDELDNFDHQAAALDAQLSTAPGAGAPGQPSSHPDGSPHSIIPWVDFIADVIAYGLVFWGLIVAAQAVGFFTIFAGVALLALTGVLQSFIINPLRAAVKIIFQAIVQILQDLVEFVGTWIDGILRYFQGDLLRAVLQILEVAAFMWIWQFAMRIPAVANILNFVVDGIKQVTGWVNNIFDGITSTLEDFRKNTEAQLADVFDQTTALGKQLTSSFDQAIDRVIGGLESRFAQLRFDVVSHVDIVTQALTARVTVLGQTLQLIPDEVRKYITTYNATHPYQAVAGELSASVAINANGLGDVMPAIGPWQILDELVGDLQSAIVGVTVGPEVAGVEFVTDLSGFLEGNEADVGPWPGNPYPPPAGTAGVPAIVATGNRPGFVPGDDWSMVQQACPAPHLQLLVAAIGWHETHWGTLGAGTQGYILGVGVTAAGPDPTFTGLPAQLAWACPRLASAFPVDTAVTRDALIAFGRDVYAVPDPQSWGADVFTQYVSLQLNLGVGVAP